MTEPAARNFEKIASGIYLEGLAVDTRRNIVWYSDVIGGGIHGLTPDGTTLSFNEGRMWTGGIMLNEDGAVLSSGQGGIMWNHPETGKSGWLLREIDGEAINGINEMIPDFTGGIFFGTVDLEMILRGEPTRPSRIYRLTREGEVIRLADIQFSNGMMFDAVRRHFYCNDTFTGTRIFDVSPELTLTNPRMLIAKEDADGMALDGAGNVWITGFRSATLTRVAPDGAVLSQVETPAGAITQIRFGGADMRDCYINAVPADGGDRLKDGVMPTEKKSFLYRGRSTIPGMPIPPAQFRLG
ncbi:MAG TPA: SMP-30/gluconolactonase/LRE family protein [Acetobacteraceae bacterium]|nr:SMP-30/gluconolactonase/LRE family protein [Acetobacteraceae bacterium]